MFEGEYCPNCDNYIKDLEQQLADAELAVAKYEAQSTTNFWRAKKAEQELSTLRGEVMEYLRDSNLASREALRRAALRGNDK